MGTNDVVTNDMGTNDMGTNDMGTHEPIGHIQFCGSSGFGQSSEQRGSFSFVPPPYHMEPRCLKSFDARVSSFLWPVSGLTDPKFCDLHMFNNF